MEFQFVLDIDTLISNLFLGPKNMKFGDVPSTKAFHFNVLVKMEHSHDSQSSRFLF